MRPPGCSHLLLAVVMIGTGACGVTPPPAPVPVEGSAEERSLISGEWTGRYWSKDTGRHGAIRFQLPEQADTGFGEVEITFSPTLRMAEKTADPDDSRRVAVDAPEPRPCTVLDIRFVRIENDRIRGTIAPYWDPECNCRTHTVFEGKRSNNRIVGTFSSRRESDANQTFKGSWEVERAS